MAYSTLFGRGFGLGRTRLKPEEAPPSGDKSEAGQRMVNSAAGGSATPGAAGGGFRGMFMRKNLPRTLQILGAGLQDINGSGNLAAFQGNEAEQLRQSAEEMAQSREQKVEDGEAAQYDQYVNTLDPQYQPLARMDREGFLRSQMPMSAQERTRADFQERQFQETQRHNRATEAGGGGGSGRIQYRPVTPQEAQVYNLPGNGAGFVMGTNGRPIRVGGGGSFSADQRARVEIGLDPALEGVMALDRLETNGGRSQTRSSPRNSQWGASLVDMVDGEGTGAVARNWGGQDFQSYSSASSAFESGMLPILSGAAVTDSEARRMIRAAIPQLGDGPQVLEDKARRRRQMVNGAAIIGGRNPPFPQDAVPQWASGYNNAYANASAGAEGGGPPDGVTPEEWDAMTPEERALFQ